MTRDLDATIHTASLEVNRKLVGPYDKSSALDTTYIFVSKFRYDLKKFFSSARRAQGRSVTDVFSLTVYLYNTN